MTALPPGYKPTPTGRCRLAVVVDGQQGDWQNPALEDVPPGGEYETLRTPQRPIGLYRIVVEGFHLSKVEIGNAFVTFVLCDASEDRRWYRPEPDGPIEVVAGLDIRLYLRNETDAPQKPKITMIVQEETP